MFIIKRCKASAGGLSTSIPHNTNKLRALSAVALQIITNVGLFYMNHVFLEDLLSIEIPNKSVRTHKYHVRSVAVFQALLKNFSLSFN